MVEKIKGIGGLEDLSDDELLMLQSTVDQRYVVVYNAIKKWSGRKNTQIAIATKKYYGDEAAIMRNQLLSCREIVRCEFTRRGLKYQNQSHNVKRGDRVPRKSKGL